MTPRTAVAARVAALALALAACGSETPTVADDPQPEPAPSATAAPPAVGDLCPEVLPQPAEGLGTTEPAASAPSLAAAASAYVCRFDLRDERGFARAGEPRELGAERLGRLEEALAGLEPAAADRACTMDLGPRFMVVLVHADGDTTAVVVDAYGCREVRVSPDPLTSVPGEEGGTLTSPADLLELLGAGR